MFILSFNQKKSPHVFSMISEITESLLADGSAGGILDAVQKDRVTKQDLNVVLLELITGATEPVR